MEPKYIFKDPGAVGIVVSSNAVQVASDGFVEVVLLSRPSKVTVVITLRSGENSKTFSFEDPFYVNVVPRGKIVDITSDKGDREVVFPSPVTVEVQLL
jgi:hypothetical protein